MNKLPEEIDYNNIFVEENPAWSQTSVKCMGICPKQYFFSRVLKLQRKATPDMIRGTIIHGMIEKFWKEENGVYIPVPRYGNEDSFAGVARSRIANARREAYRTGRTRDGLIDENILSILWSKRFIEETEEMARLVYRRYTTEDEIERVASGKRLAELSLSGEVDFDGKKISYTTKIDEVLPPIVLRDHKTGYTKMPSEFVHKDLQFSLYALALWSEIQKLNSPLQKDYGDYYGMSLDEFLENLEIQIHHIPPVLRMREKGLPESEIPTESLFIPTKRNSEQIKELLRTIISYTEILKRKDFRQTTDTSVCTYKCGYTEICPAINPEEILRRAEEVQNKAKEEENSLFLWAGVPIERSDSQMRKRKTKQKVYEKQKVMRFMKKTNELKA
ncbi:MAG: PD-(D/E)XK nuclease family protein [Candidatus Pacearchaeota archaeon]